MRGDVKVPNLHMVSGPEGVLLDGWIRVVGVGGTFYLFILPSLLM